MDYERAVKRPVADLKTLAIGVALELASLLLSMLLILPGLLVGMLTTGFRLKCAKTAMNNDFKLPEWSDWGKLFVSGLIGFLIEFIYMLPAMIVMIVSFGTALFAMITSIQGGLENLPLISIGSLGLGVLISLLLILVAAYLLPAALMGYIRDDKFGSAFKFREIIGKVTKLNYLTAWIAMALYSLVLITLLSLIPIVGSVAGLFIAGVTAFTVFGEVYSET